MGKRRCTECNDEMTEGYCIEGGREYYCCDECLHKHHTQEEYLEMYYDEDSQTYYTEWDGEDGDDDEN
jgi:hypothetical protein